MNVGAIILDPKFFCPYFLARGLHVSKEHVGLYTVETETASTIDEHVNIRTLVARMDHAFENNDYSNVLHASASIFETMAKDIIGSPTIQDKTLKSFFDRYRADSKLPNEVLDYILTIYDNRNVTALAGHGSLTVPTITKGESIILIEMTKAFIRIEDRIQREAQFEPVNCFPHILDEMFNSAHGKL